MTDTVIANPFDAFDSDEDTTVLNPPPSKAGDFSAAYDAPMPVSRETPPSTVSRETEKSPFDEFDADEDAPQKVESTSIKDPLLVNIQLDSARNSARELTQAEREGFDFDEEAITKPKGELSKADKASFGGSFQAGLIEENPKAFADMLDHLSLGHPDYKDTFGSWAKSIRDAVDKDGSGRKAVYKSYREIGGISDAWGWAKEAAGRNIGMMTPSLLASFGAAAVGSNIGGRFGGKTGSRVGGALGAFGGAMVGSVHLHVSEMRRALMKENIAGEKLYNYTNYGAAVLTGLDSLFPALQSTKLLGIRRKVSAAVVRRLMAGGALRTPAEFTKRYGKRIAQEMVLEVATELMQEGITSFVPKPLAGKEITQADLEKFAFHTAPEVALQTLVTVGVVSTPGSAISARADIKEAQEEATFPGDRPELRPDVSRETKGDQLGVEEEQQPAVSRETPRPGEEAQQADARKVAQKAVDVIQFIRGLGGVRPTGELKAMDAGRYPGLVSRKGLDVDKVRERLVEAGFLEETGPDQPAVTLPDDVYELISRAMSGERIVPTDQRADDDARLAGIDEQEAQRVLADMEVTYVEPELTRLELETGDQTISSAYRRLSRDQRDEVTDRYVRGDENLDDLIEEMTIRSADPDEISALAARYGASSEQVGVIRDFIQSEGSAIDQTVSGLIAAAKEEIAARPAEQRHPGARPSAELQSMTRQTLIDDGARFGVRIPASASKLAAIEMLQDAYAFPPVQADQAAGLTEAEVAREAGTTQDLTPAEVADQLEIVRASARPAGEVGQAGWEQQVDALTDRIATMPKAEAVAASERVLGRKLEKGEVRSRRALADLVSRETRASGRENVSRETLPLTGVAAGEGAVALTPLAEARRNRLQAAVTAAVRQILPSSIQAKVVDRIEISKTLKDARLLISRISKDIDHVSEVDFKTESGQSFFATFSKPDGDGNIDVEVFDFNAGPKTPPIGNLYLEFRGPANPKIHGFSGPRYEVALVRVSRGQRGQGIATALYDAVEGALGIKMAPSGLLYAPGYKLWKKRNPKLLEGYQFDANEDSYISPLQIKVQIGFLKKEITRMKDRGVSAKELERPAATLKRYQGMWKKVPAELKRQNKLDQMFSLRGFYSPAIRAAEQISQKKGSGKQFFGQIANAPGIKTDELEWMGLEEFLSDKKSITKEEVLAFMEAHQVELDEKALGRPVPGTESTAAPSDFQGFKDWLGDGAFDITAVDPDGDFLRIDGADGRSAYVVPTPDTDGTPRWTVVDELGTDINDSISFNEAEHIATGYLLAGDLSQGTRFQKYKVPGGENYRELLIRLPRLGEQKDGAARYTSPHFQDQEIVHLRVDDRTLVVDSRTGPDGGKVLFINEIQSDIHQYGRRKGYKPENRMDLIGEKTSEIGALLKKHNATKVADLPGPAQDKYASLMRDVEQLRKAHDLPPNAPLKGDLWLELALKRALLYAAENGYDAVSWARSDQIAKAVGADPKSLSVQYDQKIPRFLGKYTKKWGGELSEINLDGNAPGFQNGLLRITPEMRESVASGQPLFSVRSGARSAWQADPDLVALGQADPEAGIISIAMRAVEAEAQRQGIAPETQAAQTARHETIELLRALGLFTEKEWSALEAAAAKEGWVTPELRANYTELYGGKMAAADLEQILLKEAIADQFGAYYLGEKAHKGVIGKAFAKIKEFLSRVSNMARGMGFQTWEDVFTRIDAGELARRYDAEAAGNVPRETSGRETPGRETSDQDVAGVVRAGQLPDAPGFQPDPNAVHPVVRLSTIIRDFRELLNMPVRQGRMNQRLRTMAGRRGAQLFGQYSRRTGVTRLVVSNDFDSLSHEGGHHMEILYGPELDPIMQRSVGELGALAQAIGYQPDDVREGFAEFFRRYITVPQLAEARAPQFFSDFEAMLSQTDPQMLGALQNIQSAYLSFLTGSPAEIAAAGQTVIVGRDNARTRFLQDVEDNGWVDTIGDRLHQLYYNTLGKNHGWWMAQKHLLDLYETNVGRRIDLMAENSPDILLRKLPHTTAAAQQDLKNGVALRASPNGIGPSMHDVLTTAFGGTQRAQWSEEAIGDFGSYLIARRAVRLYVQHSPALRQAVLNFVQQSPSLQYLLARLPQNQESELEYPPTIEPLSVHLAQLLRYEQTQPHYRNAAEQYYQFNRNMLRLLFEKGLIGQEEYSRLIIDNDYAPFQRDMSDRQLTTGPDTSRRPNVNGPLANKYGVHRAIHGSTRNIINPIQSTVQFVYESRLRIAFNDTLRAMDRLATAAGNGSGAIFERLPAHDPRAQTVEINAALRRAARAAGLSETDTTVMLANVEGYIGENAVAQLFTFQQTSERGERIVWFYENGKPVPALLADGDLGRMMFESFTTLGRRSPDTWIELLAIPAGTVRAGVTGSFEFIFRNIFVDAIAASINSPYAIPLYTQLRGIGDIMGGGRYQQLYNRYAGMMGGASVQALSDQSIERDINDLRNQGFTVRRPRNFREFLRLVLGLGEFSETATRVGIFRAAMDSNVAEGMSEQQAAIEAGHAAHDVMDFSRYGSKTEFLRRTIPFFNAHMQAMDKYARTITAQGQHGSAIRTYLNYRLNGGRNLTRHERANLALAQRSWMITTLGLGGVSFLFSMLGADDDDIKDVPQSLRSSHWIVSLDGVLNLIPKDIRSFLSDDVDSDVLVRLPKPFEMAWFANAMERAIEAGRDGDETAFDEFMKDMWHVTVPPTNIPGLDVLYGFWGNRDWYSGRPIIPEWEQDKARKDQYGPYTSEAAKAIGSTLNVAPYYVDYLARGLGASVARDVTTGIDMSVGKGPESRIENIPVARRFLYNVGRSSRSIGQFYKLYNGQDGIVNWFWDTLSQDARSFTAAKLGYRDRKIVAEDEAAANDFYEELNPDQKVFATLGVDFRGKKAKLRTLHPMENAREGVAVVNKLMKEIVGGKFLAGKKKEQVALDRQQMSYLRNELGHIRRGMASNGLHVMGVPGWSNRKLADIDARLGVVRAASEPVYEELIRRLQKEHYLRFPHVKEVWSEVKSRVLADRENALLSDLYSGGGIQPN